jgi:starvation-inducible DNA-binding protein
MERTNNVGLAQGVIQPVIKKLGQLLADYQVFYTNLRGLHWNIEGDKFYELHALYEEYYNEIAEKIDEIAERIVMLGATPDNKFSDYLKTAQVLEISDVSDWRMGATLVLETIQLLLNDLRELGRLAIQAGDMATVHWTNHGVISFEKKIWMLTAYLKD